MHESGEMYLESIYVLGTEKRNVRSIDVVEYMNFSKASVSRAMSKLKNDGCIIIDASGFITLTPFGLEIAKRIYERHVVLTKILISLGVSEETASADACKIEHDISDESFEAMKKHLPDN